MYKAVFLSLLFLSMLISCQYSEQSTLSSDKNESDGTKQEFSNSDKPSIVHSKGVNYSLVFDLSKIKSDSMQYHVFDLYHNPFIAFAGNTPDIKYFLPSSRGSIVLNADSMYYTTNNIEKTQNTTPDISIGKNYQTYRASEEGLDPSIYHYQRQYHFNDFEVFVKSGTTKWDDRGSNSLMLWNTTDTISFNNFNNVMFLNLDLDSDGAKENLLIDYAPSNFHLKIYKIDWAK